MRFLAFIAFFLSLIIYHLSPPPIYAQESQNYEGEITQVLETKEVEFNGKKQPYQRLEVSLNNHPDGEKKIVVENGNLPMANIVSYQSGDQVVILASKDLEGKEVFYITDHIRRGPLWVLAAIFLLFTALIARKRGILSLVSMVITFGVIFKVILPLILKGFDPIVVTVASSVVMVPAIFYLAHGFNRKTTVAVIGTFLTLILIGILSQIFVQAAFLTGFSSEEAAFLQVFKQGSINIRGLLLAGILIGALGILDDITISQAAVVEKLKQANRALSFNQLFQKGMSVGHDHIASMVNTLILVYTGAALPLLLLFVDNPRPLAEIINYEIVAEEIVRTLLGSLGLVLAVPITTFIAAYYFSDHS